MMLPGSGMMQALTASQLTLVDAGSLITATEVEAALQEAFQHIQSAQAFVNLPMGSWAEQDGTALADFSAGDSTTPGISAGDESFGVRWNNHANPDPISMSVPIPPDLDASQDVILHIAFFQRGSTDSPAWTVEAFNNVIGADYQGDADFGGDTAASSGTGVAIEITRTLAAADIAPSPCVLVLTVQPKDGTIGTDDIVLLGVWLEYTRKTLTT